MAGVGEQGGIGIGLEQLRMKEIGGEIERERSEVGQELLGRRLVVCRRERGKIQLWM